MSAAATRRSLLAATTSVIMGSGITAGVAASVADAVPANPDAELIAMGRQLAAEWSRTEAFLATAVNISDEALDAAMAPSGAIVDRIEFMQAHTFEGVKVKALAISWCNSGDEIDPDRFSPLDGAARDGRIAASIVRDLLRGA